MILTLTNSTDCTADYLIPILTAARLEVVRLDTDSLLEEASLTFSDLSTELVFKGRRVAAEDIRHLWYRRPERIKSKRFDNSPESRFAINEWSEAIEGFLSQVPRQRWMNHPAANVAASNKLEQLRAAREVGFNIPSTLLTQDAEAARHFAVRHGGRIVAKPLSNAYIERSTGDDSLIYTNLLATSDFAGTGDDISVCPTLFQEFIQKECDVRITCVGRVIEAVELRGTDDTGEQRCDIRRNNMEDVIYRRIELPSSIAICVEKLLRRYELRFAAIDMARDIDGKWVFFEVNPNGQWAWLDISAGMRLADHFIEAFSHD